MNFVFFLLSKWLDTDFILFQVTAFCKSFYNSSKTPDKFLEQAFSKKEVEEQKAIQILKKKYTIHIREKVESCSLLLEFIPQVAGYHPPFQGYTINGNNYRRCCTSCAMSNLLKKDYTKL